MIRHVIFDMDGVLFDTERLSQRVWREEGDALGVPGMGEAISDYYGLNPADSRERFDREFAGRIDYDVWVRRVSDRKNAFMQAHGVPVKRGVTELLAYLSEAGITAAVCTSSPKETADWYLADTHLTSFFAAVITGETVEHGKPRPDIYIRAMQAIGASPEESAAVEDSYNGLKAGRAAGMTSIMIPDMKPYVPEIASCVDAVCDDCFALAEWLRERNKGE